MAAAAVNFPGIYKHERDENIEAFFSTIGLNMVMRKIAVRSKPTVEIKIDGDTWTVITNVTLKTLTWTFKLGEETEIEDGNGKTKVVFTVEGDDLLQTPGPDGRKVKSIRTFSQKGMTQVLTHVPTDTTATRYFKRA